MTWLKVEPKFDSIRSDYRYADLLRRIGFEVDRTLQHKPTEETGPAYGHSVLRRRQLKKIAIMRSPTPALADAYRIKDCCRAAAGQKSMNLQATSG
jgi:hypothetical protein